MKKILIRVADCKINLWANEYLRQLYDSEAIYDIDDFLYERGAGWICDEDYLKVCKRIEELKKQKESN